ncbi:MAG TPA: glycosyl hydrolase family 28 protein [Acidobacteriaceae bacterium]|nr:glycosyl hydrolase family 28 protein [Acidobacteriaceae bacterium]
MRDKMLRRSFLKSAALATGAMGLTARAAQPAATTAWKPMHGAAGFPPVGTGPARLNVLDFGAKADGTTKDTVALQQALDRCAVLGGGEVLIPAGNYLTGAIQMRSNTLLRFEKDTILTGSGDMADYPVTTVRWEGRWIQGHIALIYAIDATGIGIAGPGHIEGSPLLGGRPSRTIFTGEPSYRHPALIEFLRCDGIHLKDFSTAYQHIWNVHPTNCRNILIEGLTIRSNTGNGDGIDIDSCKHVRIEHCDIATGDDCISLKSGRGAEGFALMQTTEDVSIADCTFADNIFACIGIGSETSGGIRDVRVERCKFTQTGKNTCAFYIKTRPGRGAFIENIVGDNLDIGPACDGFLRFNLTNSGIQDEFPVPGDEGIPTAKNFRFTNIRVTDVPLLVDGFSVDARKPLDGLVLENISGTCAKGISLANAVQVSVKNIHVTGFAGPLLSIANVTGQGLEGATTVDAPKVPPAIVVKEPYKLH